MTALAQASAGLALVMAFALLRCGQVRAAAIILGVQAAAVALTALIFHHPLIAVPPLLLAAGFSLLRQATPIFQAHTAPTGGAKLGIGVGAALAILCQSQGAAALPTAILLLAILLAVTRSHPLMQVAAVVAAQNGIALGASLLTEPAQLPTALLLPAACLALPLPLAGGLLIAAMDSFADQNALGLPQWRPVWHDFWPSAWYPSWRPAWFPSRRPSLPPTAPGWIDLGLATAILAATLLVPVDSLASIFAPLLGLDGLVRSCTRRNRIGLTLIRRTAALLQSAFAILAVCAPNPVIAWLAIWAAMTASTFTALSRRWSSALLAFLAAGLVLFGLVLAVKPSVLAWFCLFAGSVTIAGTVPELAVVLAILILRLASQSAWPPTVEALGAGIATLSLLTCSLLLTNRRNTHRFSLLALSNASIAMLIICAGGADGRFDALVLLILLILTRSATRITTGPVSGFALAALGGMPPFGVFPGLVLVVLTLSAHAPLLLLPLGLALVPIVLTPLARIRIRQNAPDLMSLNSLASIAWLPLLMAVAVGYFTPDSVLQWWRVLTAGRT
jgi:hypothetical protein